MSKSIHLLNFILLLFLNFASHFQQRIQHVLVIVQYGIFGLDVVARRRFLPEEQTQSFFRSQVASLRKWFRRRRRAMRLRSGGCKSFFGCNAKLQRIANCRKLQIANCKKLQNCTLQIAKFAGCELQIANCDIAKNCKLQIIANCKLAKNCKIAFDILSQF